MQNFIVEEFQVNSDDVGARIDQFLAQNNEHNLSRSHVQKLIIEGLVTVDEEQVKANHKLKEGESILIKIPPPKELEIKGEDIPLEILYEDEDVIVINKPKGMVVHPAHGNYNGTLVNALLAHCKDLSGINGVLRPGIVHRLDKDTSGILMVAKNDNAHLSLAGQIKERTVTRKYLAIVYGRIAEETGIIDAPIGRDPKDRQKMAVNLKGKPAITRYKVLERFDRYTLVEAKLETGRTHQIRVHMAYMGYPVVGDPKYGPRKCSFELNGQALHAAVLGFNHPKTGEYLEFQAPIPEELEKVLEQLRGDKLE